LALSEPGKVSCSKSKSKIGVKENENMKKLLVLLVAGLMFTLVASSATLCNSVTGGVGVSTYGPATLTCPGFTVPAGNTLTEIDFVVKVDAQGPSATGASETATWTTYVVNGGAQAGSLVQTNTSPDGVSYGSCTVNPCPATIAFAGLNLAAGTVVGTDSINVSVAGGGGGLFSTGSSSATLYINYVYSSGVPEPATLGLTGLGLLAFGFIARKRRNRTS
jgi:hypothetical protein